MEQVLQIGKLFKNMLVHPIRTIKLNQFEYNLKTLRILLFVITVILSSITLYKENKLLVSFYMVFWFINVINYIVNYIFEPYLFYIIIKPFHTINTTYKIIAKAVLPYIAIYYISIDIAWIIFGYSDMRIYVIALIALFMFLNLYLINKYIVGLTWKKSALVTVVYLLLLLAPAIYGIFRNHV